MKGHEWPAYLTVSRDHFGVARLRLAPGHTK
jgi:hypothetical protein